jgi:hypothetical protein
MPRGKKAEHELELLTSSSSEETSEPLQASKEEEEIPSALCDPPEKPKKKPSEKQLEAMAIGRLIRAELIKMRKKQAEIDRENEKKALEEKIVQKAISIKKKEIKKSLVLDEISDDETPIEEIKTAVKAKKAVVQAPKPPPQPQQAPKAIEAKKPTFLFV